MGGSKRSEIDGPGWWAFLHNAAGAANNNPAGLTLFVQAVDLTSKRFTCEKCRLDFNVLLQQYPTRNYQDTHNVDGNSPLRWSWLVHNEVNKKLGKKSYSWKSCKDDYLVAGNAPGCTDCMADSNEAVPSQVHNHGQTQVNLVNPYGGYSGNNYLVNNQFGTNYPTYGSYGSPPRVNIRGGRGY
jgi:hypothetical protein